MPLLNSRMAISIGSITLSSMSASAGEPMLICNALAPIILALSNRVYFTMETSSWRYPLKYGSFIYVLGPACRSTVADGATPCATGKGGVEGPSTTGNPYGYRIQMFEFGRFSPE